MKLSKTPHIIIPKKEYKFERFGFEQDWLAFKLTCLEFHHILENVEKTAKNFIRVRRI